MKRSPLVLAAIRACVISSVLVFLAASAAAASNIVISQFYKTGGDSAADYRHDYVELFNRSSTTVDVTGWSIQHRFNPLIEWFKIADLSGSIAPGSYYLVQLPGSSAGNGADLPSPDGVGSQGLQVFRGGSLVLMASAPSQFFCGQAALAIDRVDHKHDFCPEGDPMPDFIADVAAFRAGGGCTDSDNNLADFSTGPPTPRNSASPILLCAVLDASDGATTATLRLRPAHPNPSATHTEFAFTIGRDGPVRCQIFDLRGRRLRFLVDGWRLAGEHRISWDGTDENGAAVPAGVYFARFEAARENVRETRRFMRVR